MSRTCENTFSGYRAMSLAASSPRRRASEWNATKAGDFRFNISLIAIEIKIGLCPGLRPRELGASDGGGLGRVQRRLGV
uniref:Uncharacterized protein n=1 Tax=Fagus sylvatica TaxID=28930 RepID=A0A2N9EWV3_FAGSY